MKKVGIVNRTNFKNYGSVLQCYALCAAIKHLGYESCIIWEKGSLSADFDIRPSKIIKTVIKLICHPSRIPSVLNSCKVIGASIHSETTMKMFDEFVREYIYQILYTPSGLKRVAKGDEYSKFVCGSDQIWCSTALCPDPLMYLRFCPKEKRVAYAPSLGRNYIPDFNKRIMRRYISQIPFVSVRETKGQELIRELTGQLVPVVVDPSLLLSKEEWRQLKINNTDIEKYLLCYFLSMPSREVQKRIESTAAALGLKIVILRTKLEFISRERCIYPDCGPREFLGYVDCSEAVITDSYHGMLFSIIFNKKFCAVKRRYAEFDQSSRQKSILGQLGLMDCYAENENTVSLRDINYERVNEKLRLLKVDSLDYLKNALRTEGGKNGKEQHI